VLKGLETNTQLFSDQKNFQEEQNNPESIF